MKCIRCKTTELRSDYEKEHCENCLTKPYMFEEVVKGVEMLTSHFNNLRQDRFTCVNGKQ